MHLQDFFYQTQATFHTRELIPSDPVSLVHQYSDPQDQEIVAILTGLLSYGKVKSILQAVTKFLNIIKSLGETPYSLATHYSPKILKKECSNWIYRFNTGEDMVLLYYMITYSIRHFGSVGGHFTSYHKINAVSIEQALNTFLDDWIAWSKEFQAPKSFYYFCTQPKKKSACKRWCMILRWLTRKDLIDLGLWSQQHPFSRTFLNPIHPQQLIMPIDTHIQKITQKLGITHHQSPCWETAKQVTEYFKKYDAEDPTRFDFSLTRLGMFHILDA